MIVIFLNGLKIFFYLVFMWIHFFDTLCQLLLLNGLFLKTTVLQFWSSCKKVTNLQSMHSLVKTKAKLSLYYYWLWLHLRAIICKKKFKTWKKNDQIYFVPQEKSLWLFICLKCFNMRTRKGCFIGFWYIFFLILSRYVPNLLSEIQNILYIFYMQHKPIIIVHNEWAIKVNQSW